MNIEKLLTMRQLHHDLDKLRRGWVSEGRSASDALVRLVETIGKEVNKHPPRWGLEGSGADCPISILAWESEFPGVLKYLVDR